MPDLISKSPAWIGAGIVAIGYLLSSEQSYASAPFGQETVEIRDYRTPQPQHPKGLANHHAHVNSSHEGHEHGIETESLFGFTLGSDTDKAGSRAAAMEIVSRTGKRDRNYSGIGIKQEFSYGITDNLSASLALLGDYHHVSAKAWNSTGEVETIRRGFIFNGFGSEIRWRLLDRHSSPVGLTIHVEPVIASSDEASGLRARKYGSENKIIFDKEIISEKLFIAFNLFQEIEIAKERMAPAWERGTTVGTGVAATYQVYNGIFMGGEARYMRAYDRLKLETFKGDAVYLGPIIHSRVAEAAWISVAWNVLVGGGEKGSSLKYDLNNFERHQIRVKAGFEF
jgi:hypothetical protein